MLDEFTILSILALAVGVSAAAMVLTFAIRNDAPSRDGPDGAAPYPVDDNCVILLNGTEIQDSSSCFQKMMTIDDTGTDCHWTLLVNRLLLRFPDLPVCITELPEGTTEFTPRDPKDPGSLTINRQGDVTRLTLTGDPENRIPGALLHSWQSCRLELATLLEGIERTPDPVWVDRKDGKMVLANAAYRELADKLSFNPDYDDHNIPRLFDRLDPTEAGFANRRDQLTEPGGDVPHWFDVRAVHAGERTMNYALDVDKVVQAEISQRNFVQTLTKTFANLSIGLAIFSRDRQLVLFNPALVDLTELPVDFLSNRPTILSFFDRLRDNQTMPEPKNYSNWRERIGTLVAAASNDRFQETWSLTSGQTFRVTGRPHPDGAVAFLFEDITQEVSLTRSFRSELALINSVLNQISAAIAVFTSDEVLVFSNKRFRKLWGIDPDGCLADTTISDVLMVWRNQTLEGANWADIEESLRQCKPLDGAGLTMMTGGQMVCKVRPLINGARMVLFVQEQVETLPTPA